MTGRGRGPRSGAATPARDAARTGGVMGAGAGSGPAGVPWPWWIGGGLLVLTQAVVLSALYTPAPHPGGDNASYLTLGYALANGAGYTELWAPGSPPHTKYPPVFPGLLGLLMLAGATSWAVFKGAMAVLVSLASILVFAWVGHRRGPFVGLAVALLTLLSAGWLEASRWVLSEPLFLCFLYLALWASDRAGLGRGGAFAPVRGQPGSGGDAPGPEHGAVRWIVVAGLAALLAFFTRSAGLPLVLAFLVSLLLVRRIRAAAIFAGAVALLGGGWALRARAGAEGAYQSEFWMVNPYDPELGTLGVLGLVGRFGRNLRHYVGQVLPGEWWGGVEAVWALAILGIALVILAGVGWLFRILRGTVGVPELFLPLYAGLILLWPEVWSGDRFALPMYPLLLLYAGEAVMRLRGSAAGGTRFPKRMPEALVGIGILVLALPALSGAAEKVEQAAACRTVGSVDPFRCLSPGMEEFRDAAGWVGANLPPDAVVLNRKPSIFRLLGGTQGRTFPFTADPEAFLAVADSLGARYLLVDWVDGISVAYLPRLLQAGPGGFCWIQGWGEATDLLGILPPGARGGEEVWPCGPDYLRPEGGERVPGGVGDPGRIPLLLDR